MKRTLVILMFLSGLSAFSQEQDTLVVGVVEEPPFVIMNDEGNYTGLSIDLWDRMAKELNKQYVYKEFSDHIGVIRALDFAECDISINPIHVNELRLKMLEVSQPFFVSTIGIATTQVEESQFSRFISNFFSFQFLRIILLLVFIIFIFGTLLWIFERNHNRRQFRPGVIGLFDGLWWSAVTMTTVGYGDKAPKSRAGRVIAMVWMFTAIIIISGFTATIASTLTINSLRNTIEDLEDLKQLPDIGTVYGSSGEDFLNQHEININHTYPYPEEALDHLISGDIDAFVYDNAILEYLIAKKSISDEVTLIPQDYNQQYRSIFFPKNSTLVNQINPLLVRYINDPIWQELLSRYNLQED
ncbi:MAG: transporter substrate-binding domain-containing protein [Saprospiraceae bacterium]|nr:transporter substrate-binding domain-containing protein [Saprospiraceae bacterium]